MTAIRRILWLMAITAIVWLLLRWLRKRPGFPAAGSPHLAPPAPLPERNSAPVSPPAAVAGTETPAEQPPAAPVTPDEAAPAAAKAPEASPDAGAITGYCMRCRARRPIAGAREETTATGRRAARGTCPVCGANMYTLLAEASTNKETGGQD